VDLEFNRSGGEGGTDQKRIPGGKYQVTQKIQKPSWEDGGGTGKGEIDHSRGKSREKRFTERIEQSRR